MKTGKIKSFFPGKKSKMKKSPTFSYNLPYENHEKKSSYEVEKVPYIYTSTYGTTNFKTKGDVSVNTSSNRLQQSLQSFLGTRGMRRDTEKVDEDGYSVL